MYGNMNNNQNFNNGVKPLFENDFNNNLNSRNFTPQSEGGYQQYPSNLQPNFSQNSFDNSLNSQNPTNINNDGQLFNAQQNTVKPYDTVMQSDIPPELGEIKNLSDATVSSAPTMDVLNPMNIITDQTLIKDPLSAYENGNLSNFNSLTNQVNTTNSSNFSTPINYPINNFQNNLDQQQGINQFYQVPDYNNMSNLSQFNSLSQSQNPVVNNTISETTPNLIFPGMSNSNMNNILSNVSQTDNNINNYNVNNIIGNNTRDVLPQSNSLNSIVQPDEKETLLQKTPTDIDSGSYLNNDNEDSSNSQTPYETGDSPDIDGSNNITETKEDNNSNDNKDTGSNIDNVQSNLSDLGLDDSYNESDTLDIMDLNDEDTNKSKTDIESLSLNQMVDKIKNLINELKDSGAKIDFEEFDFEKMYQLIIKIEK